MRITDITLSDFRSYERLDLSLEGQLTILVGANAVGKTNIVEAVQLLTAGQSFRRARSSEMMRAGAAASRAAISVTDGNRQLELAVALDDRSRRFFLNGKPKRVADMRGIVPSVTFTPDDLDLMKGAPAARRDALDALGVQLNRNYQLILQDFEKMLRHKNRLLKDGQAGMLDAVNDLYARVSAQLQSYRAALFARIEPKVAAHYAQISGGEELRGAYAPSGQEEGRDASADELRASIERHKDDELAARRALVGPSRDRITFTIGGMDAGKFASQGQQRSAVLAWKLAEADTVKEMLDTSPVLLLDDVMSELDAERRAALVDYLQQDAQAIITTANLEYFDAAMIDQAHLVHLPLKTTNDA